MKEKEKKKKERPFALTEGYFLLHCFWKSEKEQYLYVALGAVPGEYITYPLVPGK